MMHGAVCTVRVHCVGACASSSCGVHIRSSVSLVRKLTRTDVDPPRMHGMGMHGNVHVTDAVTQHAETHTEPCRRGDFAGAVCLCESGDQGHRAHRAAVADRGAVRQGVRSRRWRSQQPDARTIGQSPGAQERVGRWPCASGHRVAANEVCVHMCVRAHAHCRHCAPLVLSHPPMPLVTLAEVAHAVHFGNRAPCKLEWQPLLPSPATPRHQPNTSCGRRQQLASCGTNRMGYPGRWRRAGQPPRWPLKNRQRSIAVTWIFPDFPDSVGKIRLPED